MPKLMLGVVDVAYSSKDGAATTGDVAQYIENEYHVMRTFAELREDQIGDLLADAMAGEIESLAQGKPPVIFGSGSEVETMLGDRTISGQSVNGEIEAAFRDYLDAREWKQTSGVAVAAADAGVSSRRKKPTASENPGRPEFVDTGLYQAAFRAWIEP